MKTSAHIKKAFKITNVDFTNIDREFLIKIVSVVTRGKHQDENLKQFLMVPKPRTTLNSFLKRSSMGQFLGPPVKSYEELTKLQINQLLGCLTSNSVKKIMENHFFTLGGQIHKQTDGGCIGVDMTVEIAAIYMLVWDLSFLTKLKKLRCHSVSIQTLHG